MMHATNTTHSTDAFALKLRRERLQRISNAYGALLDARRTLTQATKVATPDADARALLLERVCAARTQYDSAVAYHALFV